MASLAAIEEETLKASLLQGIIYGSARSVVKLQKVRLESASATLFLFPCRLVLCNAILLLRCIRSWISNVAVAVLNLLFLLLQPRPSMAGKSGFAAAPAAIGTTVIDRTTR